MSASPESSPAGPASSGSGGWPEAYRRLGPVPVESVQLEAWVSTSLADPRWDDFLRRTPGGQFQQSSLWAEYKSGEGWKHHRVVVTGPAGLVGGFQILWKQARGVRIGYVSKGPVVSPDPPELARALAGLLRRVAKHAGLAMVIVQPPDDSRLGVEAYEESGYIRSNPKGIIEATYLVDVRDEPATMLARMSSSMRRNIRAGWRKGVVVRDATEAELPRFFALMAEVCRRQHTAPNPPSVEAIVRLWKCFSPSNSIRVSFAECGGVIVAAQLNLHFGAIVTMWKKGWDGSHGDWHPNEVLEEESFAWAHQHGFSACDLCSFSPSAAVDVLNGRTLPRGSLSSRDEFHLRFGGKPKLLPPALVLLPNPVLRWGYRLLYLPYERRRQRRAAKPAGGAA